MSDDELARASAAAVHARVVAVESSWDADTIYTYVTLDVLEAWGLPGSPARIVVKQLGGAVEDVALKIGGQARFESGEEVFLFLDVRPRDHTLSVAGLEHGKWTLTASTAAAAAMAREVRGDDADTVVARDVRPLAALRELAGLVGTRTSAASARLVPTAAPVLDGDPRYRAAFSLLNPGTPARWHQADTATPVYVDTQTGGHPQFAGGGLTQLARAAAMWAAAGSLPLSSGVARTPRCFTNSEPSDARISVTYGDPCGEIADGSSTLAIGGAYFTSDVRTVSGINFWRITKGMVVTDNPPAKYAGMSTGCYEELLAHELGHAIGFGHAAARPAVMYPAISGDCGGRATSLPLQADDLAGSLPSIRARQRARAGCTDWPVVHGVRIHRRHLVDGAVGRRGAAWLPVAGRQRAGAVELRRDQHRDTSLAVPGVPNGVYYVRVVARNAAGSSAPTADHIDHGRPGAAGGAAFVECGGRSRRQRLDHLAGRRPRAARPRATSWSPVTYPGATTFQIPVGGTALAGAGVPAAAYYVRVVAQNAAGISAASNEVLLVVP